MEDTNLSWRKSSYSGNGGATCVEVGKSDRVLVRDTQNRTGPVLRLSPAVWRRFADEVKRSLAPGADDEGPGRSYSDRAGAVVFLAARSPRGAAWRPATPRTPRLPSRRPVSSARVRAGRPATPVCREASAAACPGVCGPAGQRP
jgi:hypothetical protein